MKQRSPSRQQHIQIAQMIRRDVINNISGSKIFVAVLVSIDARLADLPNIAGGLLDLCAVHILRPAAFNVPHALVDQHICICVYLQNQTELKVGLNVTCYLQNVPRRAAYS